MCALVPRVAARTRVVIVRHVLERWKPSNTARLAALALAGCEVWPYGGASHPDWDSLGEEAWLLFPEAGARPAAAPRTLVVVDGSWPQARRRRRSRRTR